jgi:transposase
VITKEQKAEILRLHHAEKWLVGTIARQLCVHHTTVQRVLRRSGVEREVVHPRASIVDTYVPLIIEQLEKYPKLRASRLYEMARERGYRGGSDHFRKVVSRFRPRRPVEAYQRLRTLPGEQAQVDWAHFGKYPVGAATRTLWAFVMVLSWSRQIYLRFFWGAAMPQFLRGHAGAFEAFGGVPRVLLYDNLKSAVLERRGDAIRFNERLVALSGHYRFEARPVAPARGNEKGRVERAIRYVRENFFEARKWQTLDELNAQAVEWTQTIAAERKCPEERSRTVREVFAEEQKSLLALPGDEFPCDERVEVHVGKTPYARFDLNDYSVPAEHAQRTLMAVADLDTVRLVDGQTEVARHARSWSRGEQVEDPRHIEGLAATKASARRHRGMDRLAKAAPRSQEFLRIVAKNGGNLGSVTARLCGLLDVAGAEALEVALSGAIEHDRVHVGAVRQLVDEYRSRTGKLPVLSTHIAPAHRGRVVRPHALSNYDVLSTEADDAIF